MFLYHVPRLDSIRIAIIIPQGGNAVVLGEAWRPSPSRNSKSGCNDRAVHPSLGRAGDLP
jgi:hypothetical protein